MRSAVKELGLREGSFRLIIFRLVSGGLHAQNKIPAGVEFRTDRHNIVFAQYHFSKPLVSISPFSERGRGGSSPQHRIWDFPYSAAANGAHATIVSTSYRTCPHLYIRVKRGNGNCAVPMDTKRYALDSAEASHGLPHLITTPSTADTRYMLIV